MATSDFKKLEYFVFQMMAGGMAEMPKIRN